MCHTSMKSYDQGLYFIYLHLRSMNKLWGHYDPKTENMADFAYNCAIPSHRIKCNASIKTSHQGLHFIFLY